MSARIHVGVGGWTYAPWRGTFFPEDLPQKRELEYAGSKLTSIEINGTFYGSQKPASFVRWRSETPEGFVFAVKGPRFATNRSDLGEAGSSVVRFFSSGVLELGDKLGPVNWQLPPHKKFDAAEIERFLALLPRQVGGRDIRHAIEARHESFATPRFVELAREHGVAIVIAGDAEYPQIADLTAPFVYARIMGTTAAQPRGYAAAELARWARRMKSWSAGGQGEELRTVQGETEAPLERDVYLYVIGGEKVRNPAAAMALIAALG